MFNFFRKKNKPIRFVNVIPGLAEAYPVIESKNLKRKWVEENARDLQLHREKIKTCPFNKLKEVVSKAGFIVRCPGIRMFMNTGYIVPAPADIVIETNGDGETYKAEIVISDQTGTYSNLNGGTPLSVTPHKKEQLHHYTPVPRGSLKTVLKINTMWNIIPDKRFVFLVTAPHYSNEDRFTCVTGILDPFYDTQVNVLMYWHVLNGREVIKAGTPLIQYIPIPRDFIQPELVSGPPTADETLKLRAATNVVHLHLDRNGNKTKEATEKIFADKT